MQTESIRNRIYGGLWGAIIGDALGVPVEFTSRQERRRDPVTGMRGYGTHSQPSGTWSDDSSLLLCTVEALCGEYSPKHLVGLFLAWQEYGYWTPHGAVFDIGGATSTALSRLRHGISPEEAGSVDEHDNGNGSLMRILPVALRYTNTPLAEMLNMAHRISSLTHRHPRSQMACGLYCCMARGLLDGLSPQQAYRFMIEQGQRYYTDAPFHAESPHFTRVMDNAIADLPEAAISSGGYAIHTLEASLWYLLTTCSFESAVLAAINLADDADTTGCVTGGLAGLTYGFPAIQPSWIEALVLREEIGQLFTRFLLSVGCNGYES